MAVAFLIQINLYWGLLNLLPVYPLDGGQIARELFLARRPEDGLERSLRLSMWAALLAAAGMAGWSFKIQREGGEPSWFGMVFFVLLAALSWQLSQPEALAAAREQQQEDRRSPWERDPDWWRKGESRD